MAMIDSLTLKPRIANLSVLIPSRGRPERLLDALTSLNAATEDFEVLIALDEDDARHYNDLAMEACLKKAKRVAVYVFPPGLGSSRKVRQIAMRAEGSWITVGADDLRYHTPGWDQMLAIYTPPDRIACLYPCDDISGYVGPVTEVGCPGIPIVTREWYETAGFYPNHFYHFYADTWITDIAQRINRLTYMDDVVVEHLHPKYGKAPFDSTYADRGKLDTEKWNELEPEREAVARKLLERIEKCKALEFEYMERVE